MKHASTAPANALTKVHHEALRNLARKLVPISAEQLGTEINRNLVTIHSVTRDLAELGYVEQLGATGWLARFCITSAGRTAASAHEAAESTPKERPILFSAPMVRALLDGSKTQTRRVIKRQPYGVSFVQSGEHLFDYRVDMDDYSKVVPMSKLLTLCPHGEPGDRLWVRETSAHCYRDNRPPTIRRPEDVVYAADGMTPDVDVYGTWKPSIHMPRWASRMTLEVTGVRVERLHDISRGDAMAEGCPFPNMAKGENPRDWYAALWNQINGPSAWDANPWVWVLEFNRVEAKPC